MLTTFFNEEDNLVERQRNQSEQAPLRGGVMVTQPVEQGTALPIYNSSLVKELWSVVEHGQLLASSTFYGKGVPKGREENIVHVQGFFAHESSTFLIANWLRRINYRTHRAWINPINRDCPNDTLVDLKKTLSRIYQETGEPLIVLGHSLGGFLALVAAMQLPPGMIRSVFTFSSPMVAFFRVNFALSWIAELNWLSLWMSRQVSKTDCYTPACDCPVVSSLKTRLANKSFRLVNFRATEDSVIHPDDTVHPDADLVIDVKSTHLGIVAHKDAYQALAEELANGSGR